MNAAARRARQRMLDSPHIVARLEENRTTFERVRSIIESSDATREEMCVVLAAVVLFVDEEPIERTYAELNALQDARALKGCAYGD